MAPAEAQTAQDAPAACIKCLRPATKSYQCQMCPADCRKPYAACGKCDLDDLVKKAVDKRLKDQDRIFPYGTCMFTHLQKQRSLVSNKHPMLRETSPAPAGAGARAPAGAVRQEPRGERELPAAGRMDSPGASVGGDVALDGEGNAEAGAAAETAGSPSGQRVPEREHQAPEVEQQEAPSAAQEAPFGFFDPLGLTKDVGVETFERCRESELKNGLVAMHATMEEEAVRYVEYMPSRLREVGGEDAEAEALNHMCMFLCKQDNHQKDKQRNYNHKTP